MAWDWREMGKQRLPLPPLQPLGFTGLANGTSRMRYVCRRRRLAEEQNHEKHERASLGHATR